MRPTYTVESSLEERKDVHIVGSSMRTLPSIIYPALPRHSFPNGIFPFLVLEEHYVAFVFDKLAFIVCLPECRENGVAGVMVMFPEEFLQVLCRLFAVVMRHLRKEMMHNMVVCDIVQEETTLPAKKVPINGCRRTALKVPLSGAVVRQFGIGVLQVGDHSEKVIKKKPRNQIVLRI